MKKVILLLASLAVCVQLTSQVIPYQELSRPEQKPGTDLYLYFETPHDLIVVRDGYISHQSKNYHGSSAGGHSAQSASYSAQTVKEGVPLNGNQLLALKDMVSNSGILSLQQRALGAPAQQGGEEHIIRLNIDGQRKNVLFRRNASFPNPPAAFNQVSQYLWWLVTEVER